MKNARLSSYKINVNVPSVVEVRKHRGSSERCTYDKKQAWLQLKRAGGGMVQLYQIYYNLQTFKLSVLLTKDLHRLRR